MMYALHELQHDTETDSHYSQARYSLPALPQGSGRGDAGYSETDHRLRQNLGQPAVADLPSASPGVGRTGGAR
jgi:hypothetical protein